MPIPSPAQARRAVAAVVAALGVAAAAAPADAATLGVSGSTLTFTAAANEANVLTVERLAGGYRVTDAGAPLRLPSASGCTQAGTYAATCPLGTVSLISATLGNEDDSARVTGSTRASIAGGAGSDHLTGGAASDKLDAGTGVADLLTGGAGNDTLSAERTADGAWLSGGAGNDRLLGNPLAPDDYIYYGYYGWHGSSETVRMDGGAGNDVLDGSSGSDFLIGGPGADDLLGNDGMDAVTYEERIEDLVVDVTDAAATDGGASDAGVVRGVERRDLVAGAEMVATGRGDDTITMGATNDEVVAGPGRDTLNGGGGHDSLCGEGYLASGSWSFGCYPYPAVQDTGDVLNGGDGNDELDGSTGADRLNGGPGRDTATWDHGFDPVRATIEDDCSGRVCAAANDGVVDTDTRAPGDQGEGDKVGLDVENLTGGHGDDVLVGTDRRNMLSGLGGKDVLTGGGDDDALCGDRIANAYAEVIANSCREYAPADSELIGDDDTLNAGDGDDVLGGDGGADLFNGGPGIDTVTYAGRYLPQRATVDDSCTTSSGTVVVCQRANDGQADADPTTPGVQPEGDKLGADVENLLGGHASDVLGGGAGANLLDGGFGGDALSGLGGNDVLVTGPGVNCCSGYAPDTGNVLSGGSGFDYASYRFTSGPWGQVLTISIDGVANDGRTGAADDVKTDIEGVIGSRYDDIISGNPNAAANETLLGNDGSDHLDGNAGADSLSGGSYADKLIGDAGNDALHSADGGADTGVDCGEGTLDRVVFDSGLDAPAGCETQSPLEPAPASASASTSAIPAIADPASGAFRSLERAVAAHHRLAEALDSH